MDYLTLPFLTVCPPENRPFESDCCFNHKHRPVLFFSSCSFRTSFQFQIVLLHLFAVLIYYLVTPRKGPGSLFKSRFLPSRLPLVSLVRDLNLHVGFCFVTVHRLKPGTKTKRDYILSLLYRLTFRTGISSPLSWESVPGPGALLVL